MGELTGQTTFDIQDPQEEFLEILDLVLLPENAGVNALRELRYPEDALAPLIYDQNPDKWENFDTAPLTARPLVKSEMTLEGNRLARWPGYQGDRPVREIWAGTDRESCMTAYFFRRLWEYFANPPAYGYITWTPKDRVDKAYNIEIESLTAGGQEVVTLHYVPLRGGLVMGEVALTFRIIGEVA